ncbi:hypothetical protein AB4090_04995 [Acidithiobacillus sp. IBUN Pt1247-S3]
MKQIAGAVAIFSVFLALGALLVYCMAAERLVLMGLHPAGAPDHV